MNKNYYIGLDIGTTSCGFAVTDENYNILRLKGKKAWGVRLFDEAQSAEERRLLRGNRRRLERKKLKISWLQQIFKTEIEKIDNNFLTRIKYSNLWQEDKLLMNKNINSKDSLFHDNIDGHIYDDKSFYNEYPTTYHLRQELTKYPAKDIRFLYLAIHNIIKRRGHFLYEGEYGDNINIVTLTNSNLEYIKEYYIEASIVINLKKLNEEDEIKILNIIQSNKGTRDTKSKMYELFDAVDKFSKKIVDIFVDEKVNLKNLYPFEENITDPIKFNFNDDNYETEVFPNLEKKLSQDEINILNKLQEIYSTLQLKKILGNYDYLCDSMVDLYNQHHEQLIMFKKFIKEFYPNFYFDMFRNENNKETNYSLYVNCGLVNGKKQVLGLSNKDRTKEAFYKYIKKILDTAPQINSNNENTYKESKEKILQLIDSNNFLPKQRTKTNVVFPNKLYKKELKQILQINSTKFQFLLDKDEDGLTNIDKILQILEFRIPYFVGPTGTCDDAENTYNWINKNLNIPITPWNINKVIDFDKAEDNFIQKMTNTSFVNINANKFIIAEGNQNFSTDDTGSILFNYNKTGIIKMLSGSSITLYTVSENITSISPRTFVCCYNLTSIQINSNIKIDANTLGTCPNLTSITYLGDISNLYRTLFTNISSSKITEIYVKDEQAKTDLINLLKYNSLTPEADTEEISDNISVYASYVKIYVDE